MTKASRRTIYGEELQRKISAGINEAYLVAKAAYGPGAGTALLEMPYGDPLISRDGVTNLEKLYLDDPVENMACRTIVQASRKNNRKVGDGTTDVAILAAKLYEEALRQVRHTNAAAVSRFLQLEADVMISKIDELKIPVTALQ